MSSKISVQAMYPWVLAGGSLVGLVASVWQAAERINMLKYPASPLSCNLNPVIDCGTVLSNRWASLFGFPNAFIGIAMFAMLFIAGLFLLSGTKLSRVSRHILFVVSVILILFALWFFGMSLYVIGKVCLFCIFIWAVSIPIFWYGLVDYLRELAPKRRWLNYIRNCGERHHIDTVLVVWGMMVLLFILRFRSYYFG